MQVTESISSYRKSTSDEKLEKIQPTGNAKSEIVLTGISILKAIPGIFELLGF